MSSRRFDCPAILLCLLFVALVLMTTWPVLADRVWLAQYVAWKIQGRIDGRCSPVLTHISLDRERQRLAQMDQRARQARIVRTEGDLLLWDTPTGRYWIPRGESMALAQRLAGRISDVRWAWVDASNESPVHRGDVVIDGGGHVGQSAQAALKLGARRVLTVEPDPKNLICLKRNLAAEIADGRVLVAEVGIWDRDERLPIVRHAESSQTEVRHDANSGPVADIIRLTTVDALVRQFGLDRVDLIKLDIEGAEVRALRGATETIRRFRPRLAIATYHTPSDLAGVPAAVREIRSDYAVTPSRCLEYRSRVFPNLLFFE